MTTTKPLRADARRNREALLAKARELFAEGRFDMRFDDFARLAGVGTGTLYRHFPTREALAEAVYREEITAMCARARELHTTLPAAAALAAFLREFVDHVHAHQGLARTLATQMAGRSDTLADGGRELGQVIADLLAAGIKDGTIRDDVGAGAVMMVLEGICTACAQPGSRDDADGAIALVLDGLRRPG
ncbi:TetR/AcrR family transcriptional regulator [Cellulomonas chengniuliangii]|uniref:TetR/AcrR family transcriptional regulator n=1 Tax=Cellulomonas chengniuliangii TaxID=2968084 RepID=A0ABY5L023_9CELL|nr:TetR/AcrR family transcriptional regulator [Cellulomonas chengniuliangii]MCC2307937.1 TetR/AcrR family transcriptional regulator [Cellulomonas chengniuliangii]UUI75315.1 TetR/AcrR family transcriptional regulator [Cellulomonas chengniuliangii]